MSLQKQGKTNPPSPIESVFVLKGQGRFLLNGNENTPDAKHQYGALTNRRFASPRESPLIVFLIFCQSCAYNSLLFSWEQIALVYCPQEDSNREFKVCLRKRSILHLLD